jgi:exonuclease SbcC
MKVLRLRFKNLNSLAGVWEVDFKHPDYVSSGIFAITGPTGAGKSTILDAICLALYGQTPRLGRITQSENEIMSRQTGECFAEVEFETAMGRFRCHWSQHRSRKLADGQLQSPKHEIAVAESGMILESKLRAVTDKVEEVTGMDFDRFTRSMLLAQGGFAAFLQARPDERAPILEQITGTAIYSRISIKVHERTMDERRRMGEMRAELDGIQLLSPAETEALQLEKSELQQVERTLAAEASIISSAQSWRERIATLGDEIRQLDQTRLALAERKATAAPELERLTLAGRALNLGGTYAHLLSFRSQQFREEGELAGAVERRPQLQTEWQTAFNVLELAESGLANVRASQAEEAGLIQITRALDVKLGEAHTQLQNLLADIEKTTRQKGDYSKAITACEKRLSGLDPELHAALAFLGHHQADAGLAEALAGIEQQLNMLKLLDTQCRDSVDKLGRHAALIEAAALDMSRTDDVWQVAQHAVTVAAQQLVALCTTREALLQGRDLSVWRCDAEALAARLNRLGLVQEAEARLAEIKKKLAELKQRSEELEQQQCLLVQQEGGLTGELELREQVARQMQDNVILLNRVRSLEEDRTQLVDGAPCPLCGSVEHPYAVGNIPQLDVVQKELGLAVAAVKMVREQHSTIKLKLVAVVKDLQRVGQEQTEIQERQACDESFCVTAAAELAVCAEPDGSVLWMKIMRHDAEELTGQREVIQCAERQEQEERDAQTVLARLKDELAGRDKERLSARMGHENALAERARLEAETAALHDGLGRLLAEIGTAVALYGCTGIVLESVDELLTALTARRTAYVQTLQTRERLDKERGAIAAEMETARALLAESEKTLNDKELQLRDRNALRETLVEQRLEKYGERNPDAEEKRLAEALRQAGELREAALQEQNRLQADLGGLKQQIERLTLSIAERADPLAGLEVAFFSDLTSAGFTAETDFLQACLPQERFDELTHLAAKLRNDETALQTRYQDRTEALEGELNKNLTDKPLDQLQEENRTVARQLSELQKRLGALEQRLQQHAEQQQRHQERIQAIELQRLECGRWERLHILIGSGDGKKFRNFAQGLTFELMVAHANRQLQKMSDRYILVRDGAEPLELNVIDNYQAGEIRSTKNLSGGESFIASLALSLGLSSMASRNVRVDSLFLDEGFGTLDEDALETALETLSGLQQDGKLIGIISHVPALKERIGTQIQVESGSAGRSSLSGPGCRRVA